MPTDFLAKALEVRAEGNSEAAYQFLLAHARSNPTTDGWHALGQSLNELGRHEASAAAYMRGDPENYQTLVNLGWSLHQAGRSEDGVAYLHRAAGIAGKTDPVPWTDYSQCLLRLGRADDALAAARIAVALSADPSHKIALSQALFACGECGEAFRVYEARIPFKLKTFLEYPFPRWDGGYVDRLLVQAEMGIGDTIWGMRWVRHVAGRVGHVLFYVHPELLSLVRWWCDLEGMNTVEVYSMPRELPDADAFVPLLSVPNVISECAAPNDSAYLGSVSARTSGNIGIVWASNPNSEEARWRDMALTDFLPLIERPDLTLHSLQYGPPSQDIGKLGMHALVRDREPEIRDILDTMRVIEGLDLVICCDTAVAHLAGAMGKPVWLMRNEKAAPWIWPLSGERTPWYSSMRVFHRSRRESWLDVVKRVSQCLT